MSDVDVVQLSLKATKLSRSDALGLLHAPGDAVLVERARPRLLVLMCPCGCGEEYPINLDRKAGKAWRLYRKRNLLTLFPSVWRDTGCKSHFILAKNRIYLFAMQRASEHADADILDFGDISVDQNTVLDALPTNTFDAPDQIADRIDALPWEVLAVCRRLASNGMALEGTGLKRGHFRRI